MTGFGGRSFEFVGEPGNIYSILSEKFHKVLLQSLAPRLHLHRMIRVTDISKKTPKSASFWQAMQHVGCSASGVAHGSYIPS